MVQKTSQIPELLAPAGGPEQLLAAVENGADAVYLGGRLFNARQNAANFTMDELRKGLEYAHIRGVNIYIAFNTLIHDSEMQEALEYAGELYEAGSDALIVQDLGFALRLRQLFPDLPLHFSTQGTVYNPEGVMAAERLGMKRVVLARELSLEEITTIVRGTKTEIEVFIHGALCQCYSGQCHLSGAIGGRSANRGVCAQPCRLPYTITATNGSQERKAVTEKGSFLSPKDLCTLPYLSALVNAGVKSLKIEGRMKSPEYVAVVVRAYRKYLDGIAKQGALPTAGFEQAGVSSLRIDPQDERNLRQVYNRGGFTAGYLISRPGRDLITRGRPKHWGTYLGKVTGRDLRRRSLDILLAEDLFMGDGIEIDNETLPGNLVTMMQIKGQKVDKGRRGDTVTVGYIDGAMKIGEPVYKISDKALNKEARESFSGKTARRVPLSGSLSVIKGEPLRFTVKDPEDREITSISSFVPEVAVNKPLTQEAARTQMEKTGSTPFIMHELSFHMEPGLSVPLSELNGIRRQALDDLLIARGNRYPRRVAPHLLQENMDGAAASELRGNHINIREGDCFNRPLISAYLYQWKDLPRLMDFIDNKAIDRISVDRIHRLYLPFQGLLRPEHSKFISRLKEQNLQVLASVPPITKGSVDEELIGSVKDLERVGIDGVLLGNIGHTELLKDCGLPLFGDVSFNIFNGDAVKSSASLGLKGVALSHELSPSEMKKIENSGMQLEATVYGRIPVMISEHCPIGSELSDKPPGVPCNLCMSGNYSLQDRTGAEFPMLGDPESCRCIILDSRVRNHTAHIGELFRAGISVFRFYI